MEHSNETINKKIIGNAISAYFGLAFLLLLPNKNPKINNDFVKNHAKTALFIHFLFLIIYIIFLSYGILSNINIIGYSLNNLIASGSFILLFSLILYGIYEANKGETFNITDILTLSKTDNVAEIINAKTNEQGIATIILSYIPFIGYIVYGKYYNYKSPILQTTSKINLYSSLLISIFYFSGMTNISSLLTLAYIIFVVFTSILLVSNNKFINIKANFIPNPVNIYLNIVSFCKYLINYFSGKFKGFKELKIEIENKYLEENKKEYLELKEKSDLKNAYITYIPFLNFIYLFKLKTKYINHIINGVSLTILLIISWIIFGINNTYQFFLLFPIFFGIGYLKRYEYKLPIIFDIFLLIKYIAVNLFGFGKKVREKQKEEHSINLKVGD